MSIKLNFDKVIEEMKEWDKRNTIIPLSSIFTNLRKREKSKQPAFINEMPTEILLDIFSQAIPSSAINPFDTTAGPWVLSKVCKKWNSIITTCAPLWTNITIDTSPKAIDVSKPYGKRLLDVLKHSQDQPLSIRFVEERLRAFRHSHAPPHPHEARSSLEKKLDFTFSNPRRSPYWMPFVDVWTLWSRLKSLALQGLLRICLGQPHHAAFLRMR